MYLKFYALTKNTLFNNTLVISTIFHYPVPEGLAIAFYSDFMTRDQYLEQEETGMVSLQYAVPKNIKEKHFFLMYQIGYGDQETGFDCHIWHNKTDVGSIDRNKVWKDPNYITTKMYYESVHYQAGYRYIQIDPKNNGLWHLNCTAVTPTAYDLHDNMRFSKILSINLTFVEGRSNLCMHLH